MRKLVQHELLLFVQKVQGPLRRSVGYCQIQIRYLLFLNRWWNEQLMYMTVHHHPRPYFRRKTSNLSSLKLVIKQLIVVFCDPGKNLSILLNKYYEAYFPPPLTNLLLNIYFKSFLSSVA